MPERKSPSSFRAPPDFEGPIEDRRCTDLLFLILKLCSWGAMTGIFIAALPKSHVNTILKPLDYEGNICGSTEGFGNLPYLIYTDTAGNGVCSASCYSGTPVDYTDASSWTFSDLTCRYNTPSTSSPVALVASSTCLPNYDSYALLYRCIPKDYTSLSQAFFAATGTSVDVEQLSSHKNSIEKFVSDVYYSSPILFGCGLGVSFVMAFIFLLLLRVPRLAFVITWTAIFTVPMLVGAIGAFCWVMYEHYKVTSPVNEEWQEKAFLGTAIALWGVAFLLVCFAIAIRKRVGLAIKCTKTAARTITAIPIMVLYPILESFGFLCYFLPWLVYIFVIAATGEVKDATITLAGVPVTYKYYHYDDLATYSFWFMLFELYWTAQFIIAMGQITLSLGFAKWYFTVDKSTVGSSSFVQSNRVCWRYHMGTAAFGSLIIAIIQIIRSFVAYVQKKIEVMRASDPASPMPYIQVARMLSCCCFCCLWCLEKIMKFINKNAYVQTAIFGTSFCTSAKHAFELIARNVLRVLALSFVSNLTFVLAKIWIIIGTCVVTFYSLNHFYADELYSIYGICVLAGVLAWFVADMFTDVMEVGVTTILQCFLADEEVFGHTGDYCPRELKNFFEDIKLESKEVDVETSSGEDEAEASPKKRGVKIG